MNWNLILNFLAAILAIVNPIGLIPIWQEMTGDTSKAVRKRIALMVTGTAFVVLLVFLLTGRYLLQFFNIDLEVFKVAGGILLLLTAISMIEGKATKLEDSEENGESAMELAKQRFRKVLVPLTMPMLAGPGSLTTVLLYSFSAKAVGEYASLAVILLLAYLLLYLVFAFSYKVEERVDNLVFTGFTRIFGVIVAAISVQFMLEGLGSIFPILTEGSSVVETQSGPPQE